MTADLDLVVQLDDAPYWAAISALEALEESRPRAVARLLFSDVELSQLHQVDLSGDPARAGEVLMRAEPSDALREFLATTLAGECDAQ